MDVGTIMRRITAKCHIASYLFIPVLRAKDRLQGGRMHRDMEEKLRLYCSGEDRRAGSRLRRLKRDMWYSFILYHIDFEEYFMFRFPRLSHEGRREFVTEAEKDRVSQSMSTEQARRLIWDKWSAYNLFREFYGRDAVKVDPETPYEEFRAFVEKHPRFIVKPRLESCGHGVTIYDAGAAGFDAGAVFSRLQGIGVLCEELIRQAEPLACLHPESVNTVRVATLIKDGEPVILFTFLRIGRGDRIVDNGGAGGFVASIDAATGIVDTPGVTEALTEAAIHPDTGAQILGKRLPRWEELLDVARRAAVSYPAHPYISWDFALTDAGWVVVEANCMGQFIGPQFTTGRGIRPHLSRYFDL